MKNMVIANGVSIGWFGRPGGAPGGKTHLTNVSDDNVPLCGTRLSPEAQFQWCFPTWRDGDPECERCKKIKRDMLNIDMKPAKKTNMKVHYSSATNEWSTPDFLYKWLDDQYHFTLDPCCTKETSKCDKYFTLKDDGLSKSWANECVFMNPPYKREIGKWIKKAYEESRRGATVVCLIPARTDTKYFYDYCTQAAEIIFISGRVKFAENGKLLKAGAPFPSCIVIFTPMTPPLQTGWKKLSDLMPPSSIS